jgi:chromosome segregation ATPase
MTAKPTYMSATVETNGRIDDLVHLDQAAAALSVSRRTIERLIVDEKLERALGPDGRTYVTKSSLVAEKEARENGPAAAGPQSSEARRAATELRETVGQLTDLLGEQQRQLTVVTDERRQAEAKRREAEVQAARLEEQLRSREDHIAELEERLATSQHRWWRRRPTA